MVTEFPPVSADLAGLDVQSGTGLTEAQLPHPHPSTSSLRKGNAKGSASSSGKKKRSRRSRGNIVLRSDSETDAEAQREDDRIMQLIESGCNLEDIDRMYCIEGMFAGDVERHFSFTATATTV